MRSVLLALVIGLVSCGPKAPPIIDPASRPPLPPASGTPIGILLDDASRLHLRGEQLTALREIDASLAARNEKLDATLRPVEHVSHDPTTTSNQPLGGGRHGGHRGGRGKGPQPPPSGPDQAAEARAQTERTANTKEALTRAFAVLDATQRADAQKLLAEHGVDAMGGATAGSAAPEVEGDGEPLDE